MKPLRGDGKKDGKMIQYVDQYGGWYGVQPNSNGGRSTYYISPNGDGYVNGVSVGPQELPNATNATTLTIDENGNGYIDGDLIAQIERGVYDAGKSVDDALNYAKLITRLYESSTLAELALAFENMGWTILEDVALGAFFGLGHPPKMRGGDFASATQNVKALLSVIYNNDGDKVEVWENNDGSTQTHYWKYNSEGNQAQIYINGVLEAQIPVQPVKNKEKTAKGIEKFVTNMNKAISNAHDAETRNMNFLIDDEGGLWLNGYHIGTALVGAAWHSLMNTLTNKNNRLIRLAEASVWSDVVSVVESIGWSIFDNALLDIADLADLAIFFPLIGLGRLPKKIRGRGTPEIAAQKDEAIRLLEGLQSFANSTGNGAQLQRALASLRSVDPSAACEAVNLKKIRDGKAEIDDVLAKNKFALNFAPQQKRDLLRVKEILSNVEADCGKSQ